MDRGHLDAEQPLGLATSAGWNTDFALDDHGSPRPAHDDVSGIVSDPANPAHVDLWRHHLDHDGPHRSHETPAKAPTTADRGSAQSALQAAADIVQNERATMIPNATSEYQGSLRDLYLAVIGRRDQDRLGGAERLSLLDIALDGLRSAISIVTRDDGAWLDQELLAPVAELRRQLQYVEAKDRVAGSVRIDENQAIELPNDGDPHAQGKVLQIEIPKLIEAIATINEQIIRINHEGIHHEAAALMAGEQKAELGPGSLVHLQNLLFLADAWLTLSDDELPRHLHELRSLGDGIATYSDLVKAVVELMAGTVGATAAFAAVVAKFRNAPELFASASGLAKASGLGFARVIAVVEAVHGIAVLFDGSATRQDRIDGGVDAASGVTWLTGQFVKKAMVPCSAASSAIILGYAELKLAAELYWGSTVGLTAGLMGAAFETIQRDGSSIAQVAESLAKAGLLLATESDPDKAVAMGKLQENLAAQLGSLVDGFIEDCGPQGFESGVAKEPGSYAILREVFAPVAAYKGARSVDRAVIAARVALDRIAWALAHASDLVMASAKHQSLADVSSKENP